MDYDKEYVKKQLALQGITATDEDIRYVQKVLSIIQDGEKYLDDFDITSSKIMLTMDMEDVNND